MENTIMFGIPLLALTVFAVVAQVRLSMLRRDVDCLKENVRALADKRRRPSGRPFDTPTKSLALNIGQERFEAVIPPPGDAYEIHCNGRFVKRCESADPERDARYALALEPLAMLAELYGAEVAEKVKTVLINAEG